MSCISKGFCFLLQDSFIVAHVRDLFLLTWLRALSVSLTTGHCIATNCCFYCSKKFYSFCLLKYLFHNQNSVFYRSLSYTKVPMIKYWNFFKLSLCRQYERLPQWKYWHAPVEILLLNSMDFFLALFPLKDKHLLRSLIYYALIAYGEKPAKLSLPRCKTRVWLHCTHCQYRLYRGIQ